MGELAAVDSGPRLASAVALEPLITRLIGADEFRALITDHPSIALALVRMLTSRLREADRRRVEFGSSDASYRLAQLLVDMASRDARDGRSAVEVRLSQQEIADMIGASRESVARALATLRDQQLIATGRRVLTVLDPDGLRALLR